ncbi:hypothetical protein Tco_0173310 [Tanacetum coccineum]
MVWISNPVDTPMVKNLQTDEVHKGKSVDLHHHRGMPIKKHYSMSEKIFNYLRDTSIRGLWLVSWSSKRQKSAVISSTEAEYIAFSGCCAQVLWIRSQLTDYGLGFNKIPIFHVIKGSCRNGVVELYFVNTGYQLADIFTKALGRERIEFLINKLGMRSFTSETLKQLADEAEE